MTESHNVGADGQQPDPNPVTIRLLPANAVNAAEPQSPALRDPAQISADIEAAQRRLTEEGGLTPRRFKLLLAESMQTRTSDEGAWRHEERVLIELFRERRRTEHALRMREYESAARPDAGRDRTTEPARGAEPRRPERQPNRDKRSPHRREWDDFVRLTAPADAHVATPEERSLLLLVGEIRQQVLGVIKEMSRIPPGARAHQNRAMSLRHLTFSRMVESLQADFHAYFNSKYSSSPQQGGGS